jgi:flagellar motor component MotA
MELDIALLKKDMDYLKSEVGEIKQLIKDHIHEEETRYQQIMDSKADRWVEKAIYFAAAGIIAAAAGLVWVVTVKGI